MAFFIPVPAATFSFPHKSQVIANFHAHTSPLVSPFSQPVELQSSISNEEWQMRTVAIWNHFAKYTWSKLLRAYLMTSIVLSLVGPIVANLIINRIVFNGAGPLPFTASDEEIRERISLIRKGHLINFLVICLLLILLWAPYLGYKSVGRKRLAALLMSFTQADAAKGNMQALSWTCSRTSTFQSNGTIVIELPVAFVSANQPTTFHPGAYLPGYICKEPTSQAPPLYNYQVGQNGQQGLNNLPRPEKDGVESKV